MLKKITIIAFFLYTIMMFGQEPNQKEAEINNLLDEMFYNEEEVLQDLIDSFKNYQFLYTTLTYNSDTYFAGRDIGIDQFNIVPQITYANSKGFYASISGIYYQEFEPSWDVTTATLGFSNYFGKSNILRYNVNFAKYFYANSEDDIYSNVLNLGVGLRSNNKLLGTDLTASYMFGEDQTFQIASRSFATINLYKEEKFSVSLRPQIAFIAGKQTLELAQVIDRGGETITQYFENDVFELFNTQLILPVQFHIDKFDFDLGYILNMPSEIGDETDLSTKGLFTLSLSYLIDL